MIDRSGAVTFVAGPALFIRSAYPYFCQMQFGFEQCPYCGSVKGFVYVHGHYQCSTCNNNVMPCCGGEQQTAPETGDEDDIA